MAAPAWAQEPTLFSGNWTSVLGVDTAAEDPREDVGVWRNRVDLDLRHPLAADTRVHLSARLWHRAAVGHRADSWVPDFRTSWPDFGARYDAWADLREASVQWDTRWGRLTLGRDIAQWGALELQSPLRILNPVDFGQGFFGALGSGDTLAMADWMARLSTPVAGGSWEWIVQPFFTQHRFSPFATDVSFVRADLGPTLPQALFSLARRADLRLDRSLSDTLTQALKPPPATPLAGSVATRFQRRVGEVELGLVGIWNWDRLPKLNFDPDLQLVLGKLADAGFDQARQVAAFTDPTVQAATIKFMADSYMAGKDPRHPHAAPIYGDLRGLPPMLIQVGACETLLDDSIQLARVAGMADVPVDLQIWPEMIHVWHSYHPILTAGRRAIAQGGAFVRQNLKGN